MFEDIDSLEKRINILISLGHGSLALRLCEQTVGEEVFDDRACRLYAKSYRSVGDIDSAYKMFSRAVSLNEHDYVSMSGALSCSNQDADNYEDLLLRQLETVDGKKRSKALYLLSKIYRMAERHDYEFDYLKKANDLYRRSIEYDLSKHLCYVRQQIETLPGCWAGSKFKTGKVIFVAGLPRTGSTLVAAILERALGAYSIGERSILHRLIGSYNKETERSVASIDLIRIRNEYDAISGRWNIENSEYIIDKTPYNYYYIPLISKIFPGSVVVVVERNRRDVFASCYRKMFKQGNYHTYALEELSAYIEDGYEVSMGYIKSLPIANVYYMKYEELVTEPDRVLNELGTHIAGVTSNKLRVTGLRRSEVLLNTSGPVDIYTTSIGKWRELENGFRKEMGSKFWD